MNNEIREQIRISVPIEKLWEYVSTAEGIGAWFMPNDMKPVEGNEFILQAGPWGNSPCKVTEVVQPTRLSFDWGKDWYVTFDLKEAGNETELTFIHGGWKEGGQTEFGESHDIVKPRMAEGWKGLLQKLKKIVEEQ